MLTYQYHLTLDNLDIGGVVDAGTEQVVVSDQDQEQEEESEQHH